jgi:hypothetical protein
VLKAAVAVFVAAAAFLGAALAGSVRIGSAPHAPRAIELPRVVSTPVARPARRAVHLQVAPAVESGDVRAYRTHTSGGGR